MRSRHPGLALFLRYLAFSLVPVVVLGVGVDYFATRETEQVAEGEARRQADAAVLGGIGPILTGEGFPAVALDDAMRQQVLRAVDGLRQGAMVSRVRLWAGDGRLLFDDRGATVAAAPVPVQPEFYAAAAGTTAWLHGPRVPDPTVTGAVITSFIPVRDSSGAVAAVAEVIAPIDEAGLASTQARLRLVIMVAALALWLALALLTRSIAVTLQRSETAHRHLALYDPMTGLPNRHHFTAIATRVGEELGPHDQPAAIVLLDLTAFSQINNALGRAHGDELLVHVSGRLRSMLQPGQVVARLGGDVFGLLLPGVDSPTALSLLPLVHDVLGAELDVAGIPVSFEAAVGVASFPVDGEDMATVLQRADLALEAAKTGHAGAVAYSPQLDRTDPSQLGLAVELRRAMANGELFLVYQPKVHLADLTLRSAEALLRWNHPVRGPIPPSTFVPVAESTGLIVPLTAWVVEQAVQQASRWYGQGLPLRVAVNVSARNLRDERLPDQVLRSLARHQLPAELIELEITETAVLADPDGAARAVRRMRDAGVAVALDDFGQGATSLRHLRNLPLTTLKIDKCFVDNVCGDPIDAAIVYATIGLGHQLGMEVVAEGVETEQQYAALAAWGCDVAQGYYFERPLTVQQLNARFVAGAPDASAAAPAATPTELVGADSRSAALAAAPMPMAPIEGVDVYR